MAVFDEARIKRNAFLIKTIQASTVFRDTYHKRYLIAKGRRKWKEIIQRSINDNI